MINFLCALLQGSTGFGYALVSMCLMPLLLPMPACSAISAVIVVVIALQMCLTLHKYLKLRIILWPMIGCMLTINLGLWILNHCNEMHLRLILAALILFVTGLFFYTRVHQIHLENRWYYGLAAGMITGVSTGMFNIVGPFLMIYYMNVCESTLNMKASLEFSFLIAGLYSAVMHIFVFHDVTGEILPLMGLCAIAAIGAGLIGLQLYKKCDKDKISKFIYIILPLMAANLIYNGLK